MLLVLLLITKIVIATLLALLYVAAPLAIALWPLPETSWLARTWLQSLIGVLLWPVVWALCFAIFAVMSASAFTLTGSFGAELVKPWVAVAALFVAFKAPQLLARQAMLAGLTPVAGQHRRAGARVRPRRDAHRRRGGGAEGVSGRFGSGAAGAAAGERGRGMRHPTYKHLEAQLRLGSFSLGQWAQITAAGRAAAVVRRVPVAVSDERDDLRVDRRRRHAGRPVLRRDGARVLGRRVRRRGVAVLARAAALPARRRRARHAATSFSREPSTGDVRPSRVAGWPSGSRCGTSEAPAGSGGAAGGG